MKNPREEVNVFDLARTNGRRPNGKAKRTFLLLLFAAISLCLPLHATQESKEMRLGYTTGSLSMHLGYATRLIIRAAIELPSEQLTGMAGSRITRLRVGIGNELTDQINYIFITDDLNGTPLYRQEVPRFNYGWNEITLDKPFEIDGRKLYVGYRYESEGETLSLDGEKDNPLANWIFISQTDENSGFWAHQGGGALNIQAVVEGDNLPQHDVAIDRHSIPKYGCVSASMPLRVVVRNLAAANIHTLGVCVTFDGEEMADKTIEGLDIPSGNLALVNLGDFAFSGNTIGDLKVNITSVNGVADEQPANNEVTVQNLIVRKDYAPRIVLLEHFSTMECNNCPNGHTAIEDALRFRPDVIHVVHHAGFRTDELTIPESENYLWFYTNGQAGSVFAPGAMLDRTNLSAIGATDGTGSTPGPAFSVDRDILGALMDNRLSSPALITLTPVADYDPDTRTLTVTVRGHIPNGSADRLKANDPRLTVMLTENGIEGRQGGVTVPMDGPYIHDHVLRDVLTKTWGDALVFDEQGNFESGQYKVVLPAGWNAEKMQVVAFVSDYDSGSPNKCGVFNAAETAFTTNTGLHQVHTTPDCTLRITDGMLTLPEGCDRVDVYTVDGRTLLTESGPRETLSLKYLPKGIYIVTIHTNKGILSAKVSI